MMIETVLIVLVSIVKLSFILPFIAFYLLSKKIELKKLNSISIAFLIGIISLTIYNFVFIIKPLITPVSEITFELLKSNLNIQITVNLFYLLSTFLLFFGMHHLYLKITKKRYLNLDTFIPLYVFGLMFASLVGRLYNGTPAIQDALLYVSYPLAAVFLYFSFAIGYRTIQYFYNHYFLKKEYHNQLIFASMLLLIDPLFYLITYMMVFPTGDFLLGEYIRLLGSVINIISFSIFFYVSYQLYKQVIIKEKKLNKLITKIK